MSFEFQLLPSFCSPPISLVSQVSPPSQLCPRTPRQSPFPPTFIIQDCHMPAPNLSLAGAWSPFDQSGAPQLWQLSFLAALALWGPWMR